MTDDDALLAPLAAAIADGDPVDWSTAKTNAPNEAMRELIRRLQFLAELSVLSEPAPADAPEAGAAPPPGPLGMWGPYALQRELGRGGFATVYAATDGKLPREVALKLLNDPDRAPLLELEARLLATVHHPNVVQLFDRVEFDGRVGLVMELVDGSTLAQLLVGRGPFAIPEAVRIAADVCAAVGAVHKAGLLHRDIKSHNVMLEPGGRVVLMDLGAGEVRPDRVSGPRPGPGTPLYLAPEVVAGHNATVASDVYSIGVLLYFLLTGRYPVEGRTLAEIAAAHGRGKPAAVTDVRAEVPADVAGVLACALHRDPSRRFENAEEFERALRAVLPPAAGPKAVAVLPFDNLGPDQDIGYFCDGLAEELLTALGRVKGLRVASRTASLRLKQHRASNAADICRQLNIRAFLEGTIRKSGDEVRITAQLVSGTDECHMWSEGYSFRGADVFTVQEQIARNVVNRMRNTPWLPGDRIVPLHTLNPRSRELFQKGRFYWQRRYRGGLEPALEYFEAASEEDRQNPLPYTGLADAYAFSGFYSEMRPRAAFALARTNVERALAIDPDLPEAHTSLALILLGGEWDWDAAESSLRRALELDASQVAARIYLAWLLVLKGDAATGVTHARRAQEREPMLSIVLSGVAYTYFLARRYEQSVEVCEECLRFAPDFIIALYVKGMCRALQGRCDEAIALLERAVELSERAPFYLGLLGNVYARAGRAEEARRLIAELERIPPPRYVPPHALAYIHAGLGDLDRAFAWQARAYEDGASPFNYYSPVVSNMQADPRHLEHIQRMRATTPEPR